MEQHLYNLVQLSYTYFSTWIRQLQKHQICLILENSNFNIVEVWITLKRLTFHVSNFLWAQIPHLKRSVSSSRTPYCQTYGMPPIENHFSACSSECRKLCTKHGHLQKKYFFLLKSFYSLQFLAIMSS